LFFKKRRLILRVFAGLGNQQFQYAYAKSMALKTKRKLILDASYFLPRYHPIKHQGFFYPYKLDLFGVKEKKTGILTRELVGLMNRHPLIQKLYLKIQTLPIFSFFLPLLVMDSESIENQCFSTQRDIVISGYFQKGEGLEKYSEQFLNWIHASFEISEQNRKFEAMAKLENSVSVHARRGDYLKAGIYQILGLDYYQKALEKIREKVSVSHILIFSDDIQWAKENLKFDVPCTYVDSDGPDYEHQYLMSLCGHNIIANSTFSWWAAMMNKNSNKVICSPRDWFTHVKTEELIFVPMQWVQIAINGHSAVE